MGYPTAIQIYTNDSKYYTDSLPLQHNFRPPLLVLGYPTAIYTNDKQYTTQIHFHSSIPHTITKCNVNINMDNTIAGSIIPRRKLNICLKGRMYLLKTIPHMKQELLTLLEHMNSASFSMGLVLLEVKLFVWCFIDHFLSILIRYMASDYLLGVFKQFSQHQPLHITSVIALHVIMMS
jgi:hypothetical protein